MPQNIEEKLREYRREKEAKIQMSCKESIWERLFLGRKMTNVSNYEISNRKFSTVSGNTGEKFAEVDISNAVNDNEGINNSSLHGKTMLHRPGFKEKTKSQEVTLQKQSCRKPKSGQWNQSVQQVAADSQNVQFKYVLLCLKIILWVVLYLLCLELEFGALYVILSAFYIIFTNFRNGQRKSWEPSAYSVFNPGCEAIDGTLKPEQFEREIRYGF